MLNVLSAAEKFAFTDILSEAAWSIHLQCFFVEDTLHDALKAQSSLLSWRKPVERPCITSYKMAVEVILSYPPGDT